jgi:glutathione S-transferase
MNALNLKADHPNTGLKLPPVPFFVRPITSMVADRIFAQFIFPNAHRNFAMLDEMLATAPDGGPYLCGSHLTAADILMSFPLIAARARLNAIGPWKDGDWAKEFPRLAAYTDLLEREDGYQTAVRKVEEVDGKFEASL